MEIRTCPRKFCQITEIANASSHFRQVQTKIAILKFVLSKTNRRLETQLSQRGLVQHMADMLTIDKEALSHSKALVDAMLDGVFGNFSTI
jgi:hypothetical protein